MRGAAKAAGNKAKRKEAVYMLTIVGSGTLMGRVGVGRVIALKLLIWRFRKMTIAVNDVPYILASKTRESNKVRRNLNIVTENL
jgi:hypothetical protein